MRLIPALDLRGGRLVRLRQGDFARETRFEGSPLDRLERFRDAGAEWLHVVDLDAARDGGDANAAVIRSLLGRGVAVQVAGGIRSLGAARSWLERGAARVVVGSAAVERPDEVAAWLGEIGPERLALALDVRTRAGGGRRVAVSGWLRDGGRSPEELLGRFAGAGLRHLLMTAIERDGMLCGPDLELYSGVVARHPEVAWQASGGVAAATDLTALAATGVAAAIVGRALLEGSIATEEIRRWSPSASCPAST